MYKIKIFDFDPKSSAEFIEEKVNEWLDKHPHIEFMNISGDGTGRFTLVYKLKRIIE